MSNRPEIVKVPQDHFHKFHDPELAAAAAIARRYGMKMATQTQVPQSTGIGAPSNGPAPASLERSPGAAQPQAQAQKIPFTRASSLAAMQDATLMNLAPGIATQVNLMTNAFLEYIILNVQIVAVNTGTPATVKWGKDAPFNIFGSAGIQITDPSNQAIITAISGFKLAQLNKYLGDTGCNYDPCKDPNFAMLPTAANSGTGSTAATGGSASFRLVIPIENRRRDALGALTNSAANEVMHLILTPAASFAVGTDQENSVYVGAAPFVSVTLNVQVWQMYWTSPPAVIVSGGTSVPTARTPAGLGTVGYVRAERHTEIAGGGSAPFQLTSVGDVIASINWTLRTTVATNQRDQFAQSATFNAGYPNWPAVFNFAVNDFTVLALGQDVWIREMARFFGLVNGISNQAGAAGYMDAGVFSFGPYFRGLFDHSANFDVANQMLATEAGTKAQVRDSIWGANSSFLEVDLRILSPESGATLYA